MYGPETSFLIAVDDAEQAALLETMLQNKGYNNITRVENGVEALRLVKHRPDYILLASWTLPEISGLDLVSEARRYKLTKDLPCILIGSPPEPENMKLARQVNVDACQFGRLDPENIWPKIEKILGRNEGDYYWPGAACRQADGLCEEGRHEEALAQYHMTLESAKKRAAALNTEIGLLHIEQGHLDEAVTCLEEATRDDPRLARAQVGLGRAYLESGRRALAVKTLERALDLDPFGETTQLYLGESLFQDRQFHRAEKLFRELHLRDPENRHVLNRLGIALRKQGKNQQAATLYRRAIEMDDADENLYFNLARCDLESGRFERAGRSLERALSLNPNFEEARRLLNQVQRRPGPGA